MARVYVRRDFGIGPWHVETARAALGYEPNKKTCAYYHDHNSCRYGNPFLACQSIIAFLKLNKKIVTYMPDNFKSR
jgi:hypothetical protein